MLKLQICYLMTINKIDGNTPPLIIKSHLYKQYNIIYEIDEISQCIDELKFESIDIINDIIEIPEDH